MKPKVIITFVVLVFSAVLVFVLIKPKFEETVSLRAKLATQIAETSEVKAKFETTRLAILQFQELSEQDKDLVSLAFPDGVDLPDLLVLVDSLISRSGLIGEDININVNAPSKKETQAEPPVGAVMPRFIAVEREPQGYGEIDIIFSVVGSYESFKDFLKELEMNLRIFSVQSISFSAVQLAEKISEVVRFRLAMKTYYNNN